MDATADAEGQVAASYSNKPGPDMHFPQNFQTGGVGDSALKACQKAPPRHKRCRSLTSDHLSNLTAYSASQPFFAQISIGRIEDRENTAMHWWLDIPLALFFRLSPDNGGIASVFHALSCTGSAELSFQQRSIAHRLMGEMGILFNSGSWKTKKTSQPEKSHITGYVFTRVLARRSGGCHHSDCPLFMTNDQSVSCYK
jgi:hypothetical protein